MKRRLLLLPALFAFGLGIVACDDDDGDGDGDLTSNEVTGAIREGLREARDGANELADDIDDKVSDGDLENVDDKVKDGWNDNCKQLSERAEDENVGTELKDICGDLREGLDNNDEDAVEDARDRLREAAEEIEGDAKTDNK